MIARPDQPPLALHGLLRVAEVSRALNVSDQTVYNWVAQGMPVAHVEPGQGPNGGDAKWFDLPAVKAWRDTHKPDGGLIHGGKRKGAGRKGSGVKKAPRKTMALITPWLVAAAPVTAGDAAGDDDRTMTRAAVPFRPPATSDAASGIDDPFTAAENDEAEALTRALGGMKGLLAAVKSGKVLPVEAHAARLAAETQIKMVELGKATGELVEASTMKDQVTRAFATVRSVLENLPDKVASQAISQIGVSPAQQHKLRDMVDAEVLRAMDGLVRAFG